MDYYNQKEATENEAFMDAQANTYALRESPKN